MKAYGFSALLCCVCVWGLFKLHPTPVDDHPKSKSSSLHCTLFTNIYTSLRMLWLLLLVMVMPFHTLSSQYSTREHKYLIEITIHFPPRVRNTYNIIFLTVSFLFTLTLNLQFYILYLYVYLPANIIQKRYISIVLRSFIFTKLTK